MFKLSDEELAALMAAARPLALHQRDAFLQECASELRKHREIGPGLVGRVAREVQHRHFDAPDLSGGATRWSR